MSTVNLHSHLKLLEEVDVFLFEPGGYVVVLEQLADFTNTWR